MRLSPEARSELILRGAIRFFAERGFQGQTRDLAKQLGISTGLLFRYFPTKDALIDRIYETLFEGRWKPEWDEILGNRSRDLRERLIAFYLDYSQMLHDYEWGRIYLYSGLGGAGIAQRFARMVTDRVYARVVAELRHEFGRPDLAAEPMSEPEIELMWSLHGSIFYIGLAQVGLQCRRTERHTRNGDTDRRAILRECRRVHAAVRRCEKAAGADAAAFCTLILRADAYAAALRT